MNKQRIKFLLMALAIILVGIALDQLTKWLSVAYLKPVGSVKLIPGVVSLTYVENRGAAFGMLAGKRWIFMVVSTVAILGMGGFLFTLKEKKTHWGAAVKTSFHFPLLAGGCSTLLNLGILLLANSEVISSGLAFSGMAVGGLVLTMLADVLIFRERLSVRQWIGMVLGTGALVFLNI